MKSQTSPLVNDKWICNLSIDKLDIAFFNSIGVKARFLILFMLGNIAPQVYLAQDCLMADSIILNRQYPFDDNYNLYFKGNPSLDYYIEIGTDGFSPQSSQYDSIYLANELFGSDSTMYLWDIGPFDFDSGLELYVYPLCSDSTLGPVTGPFDLDYPEPPPLCGDSPDNPCHLSLSQSDSTIFWVPDSQIVPLDPAFDQSCGQNEGAWFSFTCPDDGQIFINGLFGQEHLAIFRVLFNDEVFCMGAECIPGEAVHLTDTLVSGLMPGFDYLVFVSEGIFWDSTCLNAFTSGQGVPLSILSTPLEMSVNVGAPFFDVICPSDGDHDPMFEISGGCPPYEISFSHIVFNYACPGPSEYQYMITDDCGEIAGPFVFQITCDSSGDCSYIQLNEAVDSLTVYCPDSIPLIAPSFSTTCSGLSEPTYIDELVSLDGACPEVWHRIFSVTDACNDAYDFVQTIQIFDTIAPILTCPEADSILTDLGGAPYELNEFDFEVEDCSFLEPLMGSFEVFEFLEIGTHWDEVWAVDACGNVSSCTYPIVIYSSVGLEEESISGLDIRYVNGRIEIESSRFLNAEIYLSDAMGRLLRQNRMNGQLQTIDLDGLSAGNYQLMVVGDSGKRQLLQFYHIP